MKDLFSEPGYEDTTKMVTMKDGGLAEATAKLKAKGMKAGADKKKGAPKNAKMMGMKKGSSAKK